MRIGMMGLDLDLDLDCSVSVRTRRIQMQRFACCHPPVTEFRICKMARVEG